MIDKVPEHLKSTYYMLEKSYPQGIPDDDYLPVLALLKEYMNYDNLTDVISEFTGKHPGYVYNDAVRVDTCDIPIPQNIIRVKEKLIQFGFIQWTQEP